MVTIFDVSIKEKRVYGSLCFVLLPQQMSQSKKKYIDLCQHANKYNQVMLDTVSSRYHCTFRHRECGCNRIYEH